MTSEDPIELGALKLDNAESAVTYTSKTVAIISSRWLSDQWRLLDSVLARSSDPDASRRKLFPVVIEEVEIPSYLGTISSVSVDRDDESDCKKKVKRIVSALEGEIPYTLPVRQGVWWDPEIWKIWIRRNRKRLYKISMLAVIFWLLISILIQLPPFHKRLGLEKVIPSSFGVPIGLGKKIGESVFFAGLNDTRDCNSEYRSEVWEYNKDDKAALKNLLIPGLFIDKSAVGCEQSYVTDISQGFTKDSLFVTTFEAGILKKSNMKSDWEKVQPDLLPSSLSQIKALDTKKVLVINGDEKGLFYSKDNGDKWLPLIIEYSSNSQPNKGGAFETIEVNQDKIYAATIHTSDLRPGKFDGVYELDITQGMARAKLLISAEKKYKFIHLKMDPAGTFLLVALEDSKVLTGEPRFLLKRYDLANLHRPRLLYRSQKRFTDIHIGESTWYGVDAFGSVSSGSMDGGSLNQTIHLARCFSVCLTSFIEVEPNRSPWLLAGKYVYQLQKVSWYTYLWP